ncbi:glycosyltransferase family 2 protein [Candidatus Sumerlaeota bacterium]|nr:glycosyltransferase family 2 protein [Candidatus Sumerlaeota bacterium]
MRAELLHAPAQGAPDPEISVYVPALNEEGTIAELAERIATGCSAVDATFEIVFVDDGSTDSTLQRMRDVAAQWPDQVQILHHRTPLGLTETMIDAFRCVRGDVIIWIPADLESDPGEDIPRLIGKMRGDDLDVVCGWRQGRADGKSLFSWIYNAVSRRLFSVSAHDMNWIKAFRRECLRDLELRSDWHRFLVMIWAERGFKIGEVPTTWHPRRSGRSKFGLWRIPVSFFDVLALRFLLTFSRKPLLFFGGAGLTFGALGSVIIGYLTILYFTTNTQRRPLFYFGLTLIVVAFLLLCVGFLAELIVKGERAEPPRRDKRDR